MQYIDVIVPLPLRDMFTYSLPSETNNVAIGCRVLVQFGKKKFYTAIVCRIYEAEPKTEIKEIVSVLDKDPIVLPLQLRFWEWIASYYMCRLGDVYRAALPAALKLESETFVRLNPNFESQDGFTPNELKVFYTLAEDKAIKISEIERITEIANVIPYIKSLVDKGAAYLSENITKGYASKSETAIRLKISEAELVKTLESLGRAKKQQQILEVFLKMKEEWNKEIPFYVSKKKLLEASNSSSAIVETLVQKGILESFSLEISRFNFKKSDAIAKILNKYQQKAYEEINESFEQKAVNLLHGVTSSGKTEIYIKLIKDALEAGKQVLYLLPEIALTTQITERLKAVFGNKLAVYHSRFNDNERAETWLNLLKIDGCQLVLGARSSIFLPFRNLGLVIVDEEHESSFKQYDPSPRYNARNAAIYLANLYGAKTLLGTATPSIETYYNALNGKYGLISLMERHADISLPHIEIVDTKILRKRKQMKTLLSPPLIDEITDALEKKEQIILFQNRRGFAPLLECKTCAWIPKCEHCDVSLTYHKQQGLMVCHYCAAVYSKPIECPDCETPTLEILGYGTERVEEDVVGLFPEALVVRMDLDTTRSKTAYERIISDFETNKKNLLIGTQMVSKGLDFDNVRIVGILNADGLLNYPDFRAHEKAFQMLTQVSGRAGRKNKQGKVMLQTSQPEHPIISLVKNNDYRTFYEMQLEERRMFRYPPFFRLISIVMRAKDETLLDHASKHFANMLRQSFDTRVLGPSKPPVARIQSLYIRSILLKIEHSASTKQVRDTIIYYKDILFEDPQHRSILLHFDVDPM